MKKTPEYLQRKVAVDNCRKGNFHPKKGEGLEHLLKFLHFDDTYPVGNIDRFYTGRLVMLMKEFNVSNIMIEEWINQSELQKLAN